MQKIKMIVTYRIRYFDGIDSKGREYTKKLVSIVVEKLF